MNKKRLNKSIKSCVAFSAVTALMATTVASSGLVKETKVNAATNTNYRNVMYYGDWSIWGGQENFYPSQISVENLTHLNLAFMDFDANGNLVFCDKDANMGHPLGNSSVTYGDINGGIVNEFQVLREKNPNLKIGTSLGGWSKSSNFSLIARDASKRATFIENICKFVRYANFDFVDIDWEYPGFVREPDKVDNANDTGTPYSIPEDKENYVLLVKELRAALDKQGAELGKTYEISAALPMADEKVELGIDVQGLFKYLDFANVMTYDAAGGWDCVSGHQTALYDNPNSPYAGKGFSVDSSIQHYLAAGAPSEKLVVGVAFYTRGWEQVANDGPDASLPGLYGTASKVNKDANLDPSYGAENCLPKAVGDGGRCGGVWPWRYMDKLKQTYSGLKEYWDDTAKAPYLYSEESGAFFTYDNVRSIQEKAKYVKANNLGGMIAWMASNDKPTTSDKRDELTIAMKEALYGSADLPTYDIVQPENFAAATVTASAPEWGTGGKLNIQITNTAKLEESSGGLPVTMTEECYKTIKFAKIYIKTDGVAITGGQYPVQSVQQEDGYYVISLEASDFKLLKPGTTINLELNTASVLESTDGITVEIAQRMYKGAPEYGRVTLFGEEKEFAKEDVNKDGKVDLKDLSLVASKYKAKKTDSAYSSDCDVNSDGVIDITDIVLVAKKIG